MKWEQVQLEELCIKIGSGATPKGGNTVYIDKGVSLIRSQNVYNLHFDYEGLAYINESAANKLKNVTVQENDVLINITGDSVARTCIVPKDVLPARVNQHVAILRVNRDVMHPRFLSYYLASPFMQAHMLNLAVGKGASRNAMTKAMLENFMIPCPPLAIQIRIAEILSPYDDLIENYQRQISLLEEAAQRLYKEWFVDLHFPGYENTPIVDGVPEGWEKKTANSIYDVTIGKTPPRSEKHWFNSPDGVSWASISDMKATTFISDTIENLSSQAVERFNIKVVPKNTILLSFKLTVGRVVISSTALCTNEAIAHFPIKEDFLREYTYLYLRNFNYDSLGNTSSISKAVNSTIVKNMPIVLPAKDILVKFSSLTKPLFDRIENLTFQIKNLTEARDRLLPKLMNGEIEV